MITEKMRKSDSLRRCFLPVIIVLYANVSFAQSTEPTSTVDIYTIKEIKRHASKLDRMDVLVKVKGFIVKQINKETYEFKDGTGTILIDIDKKKLPQRPFDDNVELVIIGEVDYDMLEPVEIEAEEIFYYTEPSRGKSNE